MIEQPNIKESSNGPVLSKLTDHNRTPIDTNNNLYINQKNKFIEDHINFVI